MQQRDYNFLLFFSCLSLCLHAHQSNDFEKNRPGIVYRSGACLVALINSGATGFEACTIASCDGSSVEKGLAALALVSNGITIASVKYDVPPKMHWVGFIHAFLGFLNAVNLVKYMRSEVKIGEYDAVPIWYGFLIANHCVSAYAHYFMVHSLIEKKID